MKARQEIKGFWRFLGVFRRLCCPIRHPQPATTAAATGNRWHDGCYGGSVVEKEKGVADVGGSVMVVVVEWWWIYRGDEEREIEGGGWWCNMVSGSEVEMVRRW
ncbi:hypothetical protein Tco_1458478 [Tanacetum coccineum]